MSEPTTPGQVNYTAYCAALRPSIVRYLAAMYGHLEPGEHAAWEAAAQAVRAMEEETPCSE